MLSTLRGGLRGWSPRSLPGLMGWYYAHRSQVTLASDGVELTGWNDLSDMKSHLQATPGSQPNVGQWPNGKFAVDFDGASDFFSASGPAVTFVSGDDVPFSVLITMRIDTSADHGIAEWAGAGNGLIELRTNNAPPEQLRCRRRDDAGTAVTVTGALDVGTTAGRHCFSFPGTTMSTYRNRDLDNAATAQNVTTTSINSLIIGKSTIGQLDGQLAEIVIYNRAITAAEWQQYFYYSLGEFGV